MMKSCTVQNNYPNQISFDEFAGQQLHHTNLTICTTATLQSPEMITTFNLIVWRFTNAQ